MEITRKENWMRSLFIEGEKEVGKITFYNEQGVICRVNQGWLEDSSTIVPKDTIGLEIGEVKKKIKKDFSKKENYYMSLGKDWDGRTKYELFIYVEDYEKLEDEKEEMTEGYFYIYEYYKIKIRNRRYEMGLKEDKWYDEITLKFYSGAERTNEREQEDKLIEEIEAETGIKYLTIDQVRVIAEKYNKYRR